jgi:alpha-methylacyl-CoA racemase
MPSVLDGVTVLEFSRVAPGSMAGMMLADLGARVIKVESPISAQAAGSSVSPVEASVETRAASMTNRNKESISLDLKSDAGRAVLRRLILRADVLIEGFRAGVMDSFGFGYPAAAALNQGLVYCSLSGYGQDGPYQRLTGHDINYLGFAGVLSVLPREGEMPLPPLNLVADLGGAAMHATVGILAALLERARTGLGQQVDISYLDTTLALLAASSNYRGFAASGSAPDVGAGFFSGRYPYYRVYRAGDDRLLTIGCTEPVLWRRLCTAIGHPELIDAGPGPDDRTSAPSAKQVAAGVVLEEIFGQREREAWFDLLSEAGVGVGKVNELAELVDDPQLQHRQSFVSSELSGSNVPHVAPAIRLSRSPATVRSMAPVLGQDSDAILEWLSFSPSERRALEADGIVYVHHDESRP